MKELFHYINGERRPSTSGDTLAVFEPATGAEYARLSNGASADVDQAVISAENAFMGWSRMSVDDRFTILMNIARRIEERLDEFAVAETRDNGKPLSLSQSVDIPRAVKNLRFFATSVLHSASELHATDYTALNYTLRRPRGVVGIISPWNLPLYLLTWKIAPALATGNCVVAKPSEVTPLTASMLADVCIEAGLPPGVFNIVHGTGVSAGEALVRHPAVRTLSFTGSTRTGIRLAEIAAPMLKKYSLELGGKNPNIVFADADMKQAIAGSVAAAFTNQGQICLCGSRLFVQESIFDDFLERFLDLARALEVGDPMEDSTNLGAMVSRQHFDKVCECVELARTEGGTIQLGGSPIVPKSPRCKDGYFYPPTVITGLSASCQTNQQEIFGPVVSVIPFESEEQVISDANCTEYGLSASLWTRDLDRAHRVSELLDAGTVWINCWLLRDLRVPFGGMKQSGVGREGGSEAIRFFTEPKNVCIKTPM